MPAHGPNDNDDESSKHADGEGDKDNNDNDNNPPGNAGDGNNDSSNKDESGGGKDGTGNKGSGKKNRKNKGNNNKEISGSNSPATDENDATASYIPIAETKNFHVISPGNSLYYEHGGKHARFRQEQTSSDSKNDSDVSSIEFNKFINGFQNGTTSDMPIPNNIAADIAEEAVTTTDCQTADT